MRVGRSFCWFACCASCFVFILFVSLLLLVAVFAVFWYGPTDHDDG